MRAVIGVFGKKLEVTLQFWADGWTYAGDVWCDHVKVLNWVDGFWVRMYRDDKFIGGFFVRDVEIKEEARDRVFMGEEAEVR